eukprot:s1226_g13.t1
MCCICIWSHTSLPCIKPCHHKCSSQPTSSDEPGYVYSSVLKRQFQLPKEAVPGMEGYEGLPCGASNLLRWVLKSRMPLRGLVISTTRCTMSKHDNVRTLKIDKRRAHPLH